MKSLIAYSITLSFFMAACQKDVSQEELIQSALEIKMEQWRAEQINACSLRAIMKAEAFVDSILVVNSLTTKLDTIPKPSKPIKPFKPAFKTKPDSVVIDSTFDQ